MNRHDLNLHIERVPFVPFRITLSTNESFDVRHPEMAFLTKRFVAVGQTQRDGDDRSILVYWISFQHIAHIHRLS